MILLAKNVKIHQKKIAFHAFKDGIYMKMELANRNVEMAFLLIKFIQINAENVKIIALIVKMIKNVFLVTKGSIFIKKIKNAEVA